MKSPLSNFKSETQAGFTLIELMIVVTIVGVLTAIAFPSFQQAYYNQLVKTTVSDAHISLLLARSEAIKRNASVELVNITGGYQVQVAGGGDILQTKSDVPSVITVECNTDTDTDAEPCPTPLINYTRTGRTSAFFEARFYVSANNNVVMRCLTTSLSGRPYVEVDSDSDKTNGCN
jgi:type IV fimbrial biogenesis protein FimT